MASDKPEIEYIHMGQWPCYVGYAFEEESFKAEMERLKVKDALEFVGLENGAATHSFIKGNTLTIIICMPRKFAKRSKAGAAALMAHEVVHAVQFIKDHFSPQHPLGTETEAYLLQYLVLMGLEKLWCSKSKK